MTHRTTPLDPPMVLHGLHQNSVHYPAQWTATDNDGREVIVSAEFGCCEATVYRNPTDPYPEQEWDWDHDEWEGDPCPPWHEVAQVAGLIAVHHATEATAHSPTGACNPDSHKP